VTPLTTGGPINLRDGEGDDAVGSGPGLVGGPTKLGVAVVTFVTAGVVCVIVAVEFGRRRGPAVVGGPTKLCDGELLAFGVTVELDTEAVTLPPELPLQPTKPRTATATITVEAGSFQRGWKRASTVIVIPHCMTGPPAQARDVIVAQVFGGGGLPAGSLKEQRVAAMGQAMVGLAEMSQKDTCEAIADWLAENEGAAPEVIEEIRKGSMLAGYVIVDGRLV
jgi:hypothetical protein